MLTDEDRENLISRLFTVPELKHIDAHMFDAQTDDQLIFLRDAYLTPHKPRKMFVAPPPSPPKPKLPPYHRPAILNTPSWPAKVWDSTLRRMVHLGVFPTREQRDEAVAAAKARRAMGLPIK